MKVLYTNATVLTPDCILGNAYIITENGYFTYVGTERPVEKFDSVENLSGKIVLPGLVNSHTHSPMVLLRGVGSDLPLAEWLFDKVCPIEAKLTREDISAGSYLAIMEMLASGTTSFTDMYFQPDVTAEAVISSGIKANLSVPVQAFSEDVDPLTAQNIREQLQLYDEYNGVADGRVLIDFCLHAEYTCTEKVAKHLIGLMNEKHGNLHIHLSETDSEQAGAIERRGMTPAVWFEKLGAFDSRCCAAHCVVLTDEDAAILKAHNISIVHNPTSNMKLASGFAPVQKYLDMGINVALGTDGAASNNNLNMFEEMHLASVIHNGYNKDATILKATDVIKMATLNGSILQGRNDCGRIEAGAKADFIAVSTDKPHMFPITDVPALIAYSAQASDVFMTVVDGNVLYRNGEYLTIDAEKTMFECRKAVERLYG